MDIEKIKKVVGKRAIEVAMFMYTTHGIPFEYSKERFDKIPSLGGQMKFLNRFNKKIPWQDN